MNNMNKVRNLTNFDALYGPLCNAVINQYGHVLLPAYFKKRGTTASATSPIAIQLPLTK